MAQHEADLEIGYGLIIIGLAAVAFGVSKLVVLESLIAYWLAGILVFLAAMTCVAGVIHYWRYGMHK